MLLPVLLVSPFVLDAQIHDTPKSVTKNLSLSMNRAKAIVAYLVSKGIGNERLVAKGYGAEDPIEDNSTEAGRQKNRRTEVKILE